MMGDDESDNKPFILGDFSSYRDLGLSGLSMAPSFATLSQPEVFRSIGNAHGDSFRDFAFPSDEFVPSDPLNFGTAKQENPFDPIGLSTAVHYHQSTPDPPEVPGGYLEPAYHFLTQSRPMTVFHTLVTYFHANNVDYTVKQDKFKLKCVSYNGGPRLSFNVRIFTIDSDSKQYAVEFQRRSGDIIQFSEIYRGCKTHLEGEGYTAVTSSKQMTVRAFAPPPLDVEVTVDQARDTMKCLVQMAGSNCADVKAKAVEALAEMTKDQDVKVQQMIVADGGLEMLIESLDSSYEDVHCSAVTGVANLTHDREDACRQVLDRSSCLFKLVNSETPQVVRESARAIENIGCTLGKSVVDGVFRKHLDLLSYSKDPVARAYATRLVQTLGI